MSLKEVSRLSKNAFIDALQTAAGALLGSDESFITTSLIGCCSYLDVFDAIYVRMAGTGDVARLDPLLLDQSYGAGNANLLIDTVGEGSGIEGHFVGEYDVPSNIQRMYGFVNSGINLLFQIDPADDMTEPSPNIPDSEWRVGGIGVRQSTGPVDVQGYRVDGINEGMVFFESAEPGDWPAGYALQAGCSFWDDDGGGLAKHDHCLVQVDLASEGDPGPPGGHGKAIIVPTANFFTASPSHATAHAGPLGGYEVHFDALQFTPDADSTVAAPKGRIFMFNHNKSSSGASHPHRVGGAPVAIGSIMNKFVKVIEWNPTGKAATTGNTSRTHLRQLLLSLCTFKEETAIASGGIGESLAPPTQGFEFETAFYHPPTDTVRFRWNAVPGAGENDNTEIVFALAAALSGLTVPAERGRTETGKVITFGSTALGDLGERISVLDVDWTLDRRSTEGELLSHSGDGGTATVAHPPIDGGLPTVNTLIVYEDGSPLTVSAHYTVDLATGIITGISPRFDVTKVYTADYEHRETGGDPPHSILRTTTSKTNENGEAICRVEIPDDTALEGELDGLSVAESS